MHSIGDLFNIVFYQPLFNSLVVLYQYLPGKDFGAAIIVLTIIVKAIFYPVGAKAIKAQKKLEGLKGKIEEVQEKYKANKEEQARKMMAVYKEAGVSPFSGIMPLLIQMPILIALYSVFSNGLKPETMANLYGFINNPGAINPSFLGIIDLGQPFVFFAIIAGALQFVQSWQITKMTPRKSDGKPVKKQMEMIQKQMQIFLPLFTVIILLKIPSAVALYWVISTVFTIFQQYIIFKQYDHGAQS
ncbi:MAG: YidC/Oxa1 family membrane protein insertase [bacterium]